MKYCEYCGTPLDEDALFCGNCGARLNPVQHVPIQADGSQTQNLTRSHIQQEGINRREQKNYKMVIIVLSAILLAAGIVIAILATGKKTKEKDRDIDKTEEVVQQQRVRLHGAVDTYPVYMKLTIEGNKVNGSYYYESQGPGKVLMLKGIYENSELELFEANEDGQQTGHFVGQLKKGIFIGDFYNAQGKSMHFRLEE